MIRLHSWNAIPLIALLLAITLDAASVFADQPLAANCSRLLDALDYLGTPLADDITAELRTAIRGEDAARIHELLKPQVLLRVVINPELRVKVERGKADPMIQQSGFTPMLVHVRNDATLARRLRVTSPQAGPLYAGAAEGILLRQAQTELNINENKNRDRRFLDIEVFDKPPMTSGLSGAPVEYLIVLVSANEPGQREATIAIDVGDGTQDLGFRSEVPVLFSVRPAIPVRLSIHDDDGSPTTARLEFRGHDGRVYPPQAKRLAPDFFFQPQIYRADGQIVLLPPGKFTLESCRGPEYLRKTQHVQVSEGSDNVVSVELERWINPHDFGYWSGDHHIHGAGCSHYESPTQGVTPADMFAQVKGEGLNVGCLLTWGPCFEHQRNFFSPDADSISEPRTILKYDLEISGFGSAAMGHVCLLNLTDQTYPGSDGTKDQGWPTWTVPVMKWAKDQGGVTGYPHSALHVDPKSAADWIITHSDQDADGSLDSSEAHGLLLPESFDAIDLDNSARLSHDELQSSSNRMADSLPNLALPAMDGGGAMEILVSTPEGVCDFISAMDTARIPEWNTWYHLLNCGFPLKLSGETDFPCMSSRRVGQGRVYVQLGQSESLDFPAWCRGLADGRSYVSDGYAHAVAFTVNGTSAGPAALELPSGGVVTVQTSVVFAPELPQAVAYGTLPPDGGNRIVGDTVNLHAPRDSGYVTGGERLVEIVSSGRVVASQLVPADGAVHTLSFQVPVEHSTWLAVRQFPQLHSNPVTVLVADQPIRASRASALWCAESVRILWERRHRFIAEPERAAAREAYDRALAGYLSIATEAAVDDGLLVPELTLPKP